MHSPQQYSYIYFPELASLQTLKYLISHLQHFTHVYMHSPLQYFYIYFPELASLQTLKNLISHLQHFTQFIRIPHSSTHTYTFLNWQAFKHLNLITLTTFYIVYTHSPQQYSYIYFSELASLQTLKYLISHLQHFTQCICIPHSSTCTYTFLNWQAFKHLKL